MAHRVKENKAVRFRQAVKMCKQRLCQLRRELRLAACKERFADRLERIGNAQRVLVRDLMIRVQALHHIAVP